MGDSEWMNAEDVRKRLGGLSRERTHELTTQDGFPEPTAELGSGRVWLADDIEKWAKVWRPDTGLHLPWRDPVPAGDAEDPLSSRGSDAG